MADPKSLHRILTLPGAGPAGGRRIEGIVPRPGRPEPGGVESTVLLEAVLEGSRAAVAILDRDLRYTHCNAQCCRLLGIEPRLLLGRRLDQALDLGSQPEVLRSLERLRDSGSRAPGQVEYQFAGGDHPWVRERRTPVYLPDGDFHGFILALERTDRERHAESSLAALRHALDRAGLIALELRRDGRVLDANETAVSSLGWAREELIGMHAGAIDPSIPEGSLERVLSALGTVRTETTLRRQGGGALDADVVLQVVGHGERESYLLLAHDLSGARATERRERALRAENRLVFETSLVGLLFVRDGRVLRANGAMEELLGCEPGTLVEQIQLFAHPCDRLLVSGLTEHFDSIRANGTCEFEMYLYRRRGDPIWVAVQGRAIDPEQPELGHIFAFVNIDQRKRADRDTRAAVNELRLIFDNALVAILFVAGDYVIKANAAAERLFGLHMPDMGELPFPSLFEDPAAWSRVLASCAQAGAEGSGAGFELPMRRAGREPFWCAGNVRPIEPGAIERGVIVAITDVDARHRSEEELRRVRNHLDLVIESLPVLVSVREAASGRFVSINRAGEQITGLPRDAVVGRTWHELYGRQFADLFAGMDRKAVALGGQVERQRDLLPRSDGRILTVHQRVVPIIYDNEGGRGEAATHYVMSIIDDLTGEVRAESALRETETRFRQFAENIDQVVFIAGPDLGAILYVNDRYEQLVGGSVAELLADPRSALGRVADADRDHVARELPRIIARLRHGRRAEITVRILHPREGERLLSVRFNPGFAPDGAMRVFGIADDVTERRAREQQRLHDAVRQRDILVREVHHRIKNNLQGVAGLLQQMASGKPEVASTLHEIAGQIQAIAQVHGLQIGGSGTLPVLGIAQGIFTNLGTMFGVQARLEAQSPSLWRWGLPENEAVPIALVINELGTNAIKYRADRGQDIDVRIDEVGDGVEIVLANEGSLPGGFDFDRVTGTGVSGLTLIKALLPRRGATLRIRQEGTRVVARLGLRAPAVREEPA